MASISKYILGFYDYNICIYFAMIKILAATVVAQTNRLFFFAFAKPTGSLPMLSEQWGGGGRPAFSWSSRINPELQQLPVYPIKEFRPRKVPKKKKRLTASHGIKQATSK